MGERIKNKTELAIIELKTAIKDLIEDGGSDYYLEDDLYLLRWLKARNMDVKKTEKLLRDNVKWRKEIKMLELIEKDFHTEIFKNFHVENGKLKDGMPVAMINAGTLDLKGLLETYGRDAIYEYWLQHGFRGEKQNVLYNRQKLAESNNGEIHEDSVVGAAFFFDMKDMALKQMACIKNISFAIRIASDYMKYFPGLGTLCICINCPKAAAKVMNLMIKILQTPDLTIEVFDTNEAKWKEAILRRMDADDLPSLFGGKKIVQELLPASCY